MTVWFDAPADNGSVITSYKATSLAGAFTGTVTGAQSSSGILVTGLTTGETYGFKVTATNAVGTSASSYTTDVRAGSGDCNAPASANVNWAYCNKTDAKLNGANLTGANLTGTTLDMALLTTATMTGANLISASLKGANLQSAKLGGANLTGANLTGAKMAGADLTSANLTGAYLSCFSTGGGCPNLTGANLTSANLEAANLAGALLPQAVLSGATLTCNSAGSCANLKGSNLTGAKLVGADLTGANLNDAVFEAANLTNANLTNANLKGAYLVNANLTGANLTGANLKTTSWGLTACPNTLVGPYPCEPLATVTAANVTFDANAGVGSMASQSASKATALTSNANAIKRSGYAFNGWNTSANGNGTAYPDGASYPFAASATLYATWGCLPLTVTVSAKRVGANKAEVYFTATQSESPWTSFAAKAAKEGGKGATLPTALNTGTITVNGLDKNSGYTFDVTATNEAGCSYKATANRITKW